MFETFFCKIKQKTVDTTDLLKKNQHNSFKINLFVSKTIVLC